MVSARWRETIGAALEVRDDPEPSTLRTPARRAREGRTAARLSAIADAADGLSRAEAARLAGINRQSPCDAVIRDGAEDLAGLHDRPRGRPPRLLTEGEDSAAAVILEGPDPERDGVCHRWSLKG